MTFFSTMGYQFDPQYTDEKAACLVLGENIYAMLLVEPFFRSFITKELVDATKQTEVLLCLSCDSDAEVDALVARAVSAGGRIPREAIDHGFMYQHSFEDPDGHIWELVAMRESNAAPQA